MSRRRSVGGVLTKVSGRVEDYLLRQMIVDYESLGRGRVWLIDGSAATSYSSAALALAIKEFARLGTEGLEEIVAYLTHPLVRMGAQTVSMSLTVARSRLRIRVVDRPEDFD